MVDLGQAQLDSVWPEPDLGLCRYCSQLPYKKGLNRPKKGQKRLNSSPRRYTNRAPKLGSAGLRIGSKTGTSLAPNWTPTGSAGVPVTRLGGSPTHHLLRHNLRPIGRSSNPCKIWSLRSTGSWFPNPNQPQRGGRRMDKGRYLCPTSSGNLIPIQTQRERVPTACKSTQEGLARHRRIEKERKSGGLFPRLLPSIWWIEEFFFLVCTSHPFQTCIFKCFRIL